MSSPSKPVNITSRALDLVDGVPGSLSTPYGTPDLRALRAQYAGTPPPPNIPPRNIPTPSLRPQVSDASLGQPGSFGGITAALRSGTPPHNGSDTQLNIDLDGLPDEEKARVLRRHLVSKEERKNQGGGEASTPASELDVPLVGGSGSRRSSSGAHANAHVQREDTEPFPIPYHAPGADVTHDIYKWHSDQRRLATRGRAASLVIPRPTTPDPAFEHIHEPGGFRRNYVIMRATERGEEEPRILNNFIEFLYIFGHFAGEDLEEDEDIDDDEEMGADAADAAEATENAPLLGTRSAITRSTSRSRRKRSSSVKGPHGNATVAQAVLMLLKAFVGTGVLFLGKAFYNGGILFSSLLFVFIALISLYSFLLLVYTKFVVSGSFGDIGGALYGRWMRYLILGSIVLSQIGFVAAYIIFVAQNLQALVMGITHCMKLIPIHYFIMIQVVVFLPLVLIRDLAKLSSTALIADGFILIGLVYIFGSEISIVAERGIADIQLFNPRDFSLFVGVAVFSFEGVGMVIPITDAMREPHKFPKVLTGVMLAVLVLFGGAGALAYATFGSEIQTVVLVNLNAESKMVQSVQFIYSLAIMLSVPLQLFPAIRIMENGIFTRSGKVDNKVKWTKNVFRFATVFFAATISWIGAADLDKFVAFIGCFACVPLCYVYPAMLHYKACANTRTKKAADIAMIVFGMVAAFYTTMQTVKLMLEPDNGGPPVFGNCGNAPPS
ncbi:transmembrane amino acid transporter protein-domain-containing protein [Mycena rosella]|uniref:Transmembrane amino acid transporter protein-domain-containing protein n=1 Tax=Mycena rosella TaxID=1033263 RepID=A0AAD7GX72_MYCRO|nr:transmembrane amino acid transporter protein-domain-containing protein [Mycena rosella]